MREQWLQCPCGCGMQDAFHLWNERAHMKQLLSEFVLSVAGSVPPQFCSEWSACLAAVDRALAVLCPSQMMNPAFRLFALQQLLRTLILFDEALLPG